MKDKYIQLRDFGVVTTVIALISVSMLESVMELYRHLDPFIRSAATRGTPKTYKENTVVQGTRVCERDKLLVVKVGVLSVCKHGGAVSKETTHDNTTISITCKDKKSLVGLLGLYYIRRNGLLE